MDIIHVLGSSSLFFYLLVLYIFPTTNSISQSEALLKLKGSFKNATVLDSWKPGTEPCMQGREWTHVECVNGVASGLWLQHLGLSGNINVDALASLPGLRLISFVSNGFSGPIPDFHQISNLRGLFLSRNQFSGEIPSDYFAELGKLKKVWLSGNAFSGQVPSSLSNLSHLTELHLEDNQFSGNFPPLLQPSLVSLNISNNKLEGEIPSTLSKFSLDSFNGNPGLCGGSLGNACSLSSTSPDNVRKPDHPKLKFLWALTPAGVVFLVVIIGIVVLKRRQDQQQLMIANDPHSRRSSPTGNKDTNSGRVRSAHQAGSGLCHQAVSWSGQKGPGKSRRDIVMINDGEGEFTIMDLMKAAATMLGNGTLGCSYKATVASGATVVVKRTKEMNKLGRDQFDAELRRLGSLKHSNVLPPMAYYYRQDEKLLIYEHKPKGSLLVALHGDQGRSKAQLNWPVRLKIIRGIARGLGYLHKELSPLDLPHGNLKASNVFLTPEYEPLLADYGFISLINNSQTKRALAAFKTPEAILHQQLSSKCDVYCLGVVILEILTGKCANLCSGNVEVDVVQWVRSAIAEGRQCGVFDPEIARDKSCVVETEEVLQIGVACTESVPEQRLHIAEAVRRIESIPVGGSPWNMEMATALSFHRSELSTIESVSNEGSSWDVETAQAPSLHSSELGKIESVPDGESSWGMETAQALSLHGSEIVAGCGSSHSRRSSSHDVGDQSVYGSIKSDNMYT